MKKLFLVLLLVASPALGQIGDTISDLTPRGTLESTDIFECEDTTPAGTFKCTLNEIFTYICTQGTDTTATCALDTDSVSANELDAAGVEAELELVLDLPDLQGTLGASQLYSISSLSARVTLALTDLIECEASGGGDYKCTLQELSDLILGGATDFDSSGVINADAITEPKLAVSNSPTLNYLIGWNGSALTWMAPSGTEVDPTLTNDATVTVCAGAGADCEMIFDTTVSPDAKISFDYLNSKFKLNYPLSLPASATPALELTDSDFSNTDVSFGIYPAQVDANNADFTIKAEVGGAPTNVIAYDADGSGTAKLVLPDDSIGAAELDAGAETNGYHLTWNTGGTLSWTAAGSGTGDVVGPASATDNAVPRFDTTTGKLIQNSGVTIDDSNVMTVGAAAAADGLIQPAATYNLDIDANGQTITLGDGGTTNFLSVSDGGVLSGTGTGGVNLEGMALTNVADNEVLVGTGAGTGAYTAVPDCHTNNMLTFTQSTNTWGCDADDGAGGGAPVGVNYLVGTADATLTNEIVVGTTPNGDLGGTWDAISVDDNSHNHTESNITDLAHTPDQVGTVTDTYWCQGDAGNILSCDIATIPESAITFNTNDGSRHDHVTADVSGYVAGHGDNGNCAAGSYPLGVDATGAVQDCTDATTEIDSAITTHTSNVSAHHTQTPDQVATVNDGQWCQGDAGTVLSCDIASIPEASITFATNDGSRHDHVEADITNLTHTTDTNAATICVGTDVYLDGEGNCDTISASGEANTYSSTGGGLSVIGTKSGVDLPHNSFAAADFDLAANIISIDDATWLNEAELDSLAELNTQLSTSIADGAHTTDTNANTICTGTTTYLDGEGGCDDISSTYAASSHGHVAGDYGAASIDGDDLASSIAGTHLTLAAGSPDVINVDAELKTHDHCITIADPATDEDWFTVWRAPTAVTLTEIYCEVTGGTSVAFDFQLDDGTPTAVNGSEITCTTSGVTDSTLGGSDVNMAAGDRLDVLQGTVTGTVTQASYCIEYTIDD